MHNPKFEINKSTDGKFYFHFVSSNGNIIYSSQRYTSKEAAEKGITTAKNGTYNAPVQNNT